MPKTKRLKQDKGPSETSTREMWLKELASHMQTWFDDLGFPLPPYDIRTGFPSVGRRSPNISESWSHDGENSYVIFIRPDRDDSIEVAAALAFQMCQIAVNHQDKHGHLFSHLAISIGLKGTKSESPPGALFKELIKPILRNVGKLPNPDITPADKSKKTRQTTRMVKVSCLECGYVARVSRKWIDEVGPPHCPAHGQMAVSP